MGEKCPLHPLNDAERYDVLENGVVKQWNVLECPTCISNTPWLERRRVKKVIVQEKVPETFVAASAEKFEG